MPRSMWMGTLNFGLVSMPVKLYAATTSKTVHFCQLHAGDNVRVQTKRFCPVDEAEVPFDEIVRGYEIAPERYVVIEDEELAAIAPEVSRTIEIEDFVDLEEIDRIYFDQPYYVVPNRGGARSYRLLLQAMRETGKVAIARVVLRSRERLVTVRAYGETLLMTTMAFGDEVRPASELNELLAEVEVGERELEVAQRLVSSLAEPFDIAKYRDTYREAVLDLIDRKASGEEIVVQPELRERAPESPDLMSALEASLVQARERAGEDGRRRTSKGSARRLPPGSNGKAPHGAKPSAGATVSNGAKPSGDAKPSGNGAKPSDGAMASNSAKPSNGAKPNNGAKPSSGTNARPLSRESA
jgi:DNA end-binding protein Ku